MHGAAEALNVVHQSATAAAYLAVAGCPELDADRAGDAGTERFPGWGVALAGTIVVDPDGTVHDQSCRTAQPLRPVRAQDLLRFPFRHCVADRCLSPLRVAGPSSFIDAVRTLAEDLDRPVAYGPQLAPGALDAYHEFRDIRYTGGALEVLREFTAATAIPPGLHDGIEVLTSWLTATAQAARQNLLRDGLARLLKHLRDEHGETAGTADVATRDGPDIRIYQKTLLPAAELALPGTPDSHLACMFAKTNLATDTAIAAAAFAARAVEPDFGRSGTHAVAVLPRALVVHLYAASLRAAPAWPPVAFAEVVDPATPGLKEICSAAAVLWDGGNTAPGLAWRAAVAAAL